MQTKKLIFEKSQHFYLDNFEVRLQYEVASLCNQPLPKFSSHQFETLYRGYKSIENVHVTLQTKKKFFLVKITGFATLPL